MTGSITADIRVFIHIKMRTVSFGRTMSLKPLKLGTLLVPRDSADAIEAYGW